MGVVDLARCGLSHGERDVQRVLTKKFSLSLPVQKSWLTKDPDSDAPDIPILRLRDWTAFLLANNCWHVLVGLKGANQKREEQILEAWWRKVEQHQPQHPVFEMARSQKLVLSRTAPIFFHGDEGRGRRRQAFLVCSFRSALGRGTLASQQRERTKGVKKSFIKLKPNFIGHSFTSRFLYCALPKHHYTHDCDSVFDCLMQTAADEAEFMIESGVKHPRTGQSYWMMLMGITGDWPWLQKSGSLNRTFNHVQKRVDIKNPPSGICHLCQGGQMEWPYEQIHTKRPAWRATMHCQSPFDKPSPFEKIPHSPNEFASFWHFDVFHVWNIGLGRTWMGNILALLSERQPEGDIEERFHSLTGIYKEWCANTGHSCYVRRLTKELIQWPKTTVYPQGSWYKGGLTTVLCEFFQDYHKDTDFSDSPMLEKCREGNNAMAEFWHIIYSSDAWLDPSTARKAGELAMKFLRRYSEVATMAFQQKRALFPIFPKAHAFHHVTLGLLESAEAGREAPNPILYAVQMDEDFIGRHSRVSRKVTGTDVLPCRVIERYLLSAYNEWVSAGLLVRPVNQWGKV